MAPHPKPLRASDEVRLAAGGDGQFVIEHTLAALNEQGYAYGIVGSAGPVEFDIKSVGATLIKANLEDICQGSLYISPTPEACT